MHHQLPLILLRCCAYIRIPRVKIPLCSVEANFCATLYLGDLVVELLYALAFKGSSATKNFKTT